MRGSSARTASWQESRRFLETATAPTGSYRVFNANRDIVEVVSEIADATEVAAEPHLAK